MTDKLQPFHLALCALVVASVLAQACAGAEPAVDAVATDTMVDLADARGDASIPDGSASETVADLASDVPAELGAPSDAVGDTVEVLVPECPGSGGQHELLCNTGCQAHEDCGEDGLCLQFQEIDQLFCATPCAGKEGLCPYGFYCAQVDTADVCVPISGNCEVASAGIDCDGTFLAGICKHEYPICTSSSWQPGYCTRECQTDQDCPGAFRRCLPTDNPCQPAKVCRAEFEFGPEGCGLAPPDKNGDGTPCRDDDDCAIGASCIGPDDANSVHPFCSSACQTSDDCAEGSTCGTVLDEDVCLPPQCSCLDQGEGMYDQVLAALGLHRCDTLFVRKWLMLFPYALSHDPWRLRHFHTIHDYPPRAIPAVQANIAALDESAGLSRVVAAIVHGAMLLDRPVDLGALPYDPADTPPNLVGAIAWFIDSLGGSANPADIEAALEPVPAELRAGLAPVVQAMSVALLARNEISVALGNDKMEGYLFDLAHGYVANTGGAYLPPTNLEAQQALTWAFQTWRLYTAGAALASAMAEADLSGDYPGEFLAVIETPHGLIIIGDGGDNTYDSDELGTEDIALLVDVGGNDTYLVPAGANASLDNPVSLLIDLGGDDQYGYHETEPAPDPLVLPADEDGRYNPPSPPNETNGPFSFSNRSRQGAGRLGIGMLYDLGKGTDTYTSLRISQGTGIFGVGVLYDGGGDDLYMAEAVSQGAGVFGIGILVDEGGDDQYFGYNGVQGFAYAAGFGLLYDVGGHDGYTAYLGDPDLGGYPLYFSPQNPGKSNSTMAQGFGFGRRADFTDGIFMSGGFGVLRDLAGDDTYECDIFGQGGGYWFGTGILADGSGDDSYKGRWYVQGAAAHYATGIFIESGGNDVYNQDLPLMNASVGLGHDWSLGILLDEAGDDEYNAPSLSVGAGNADGFGYFIDLEGDDSYTTTANNTFGFANAGDYGTYEAFQDMLCVGIFLDADGTDTYTRPDTTTVPLKDDSLWVTPPAHEEMAAIEKGGGMDSTGMEPGL